MAPESAQSRTIRRVLYGIYLCFVLTFCGVVTVSILVTLYGRRPVKVRGPLLDLSHDDPKGLETCVRELSGLHAGLVNEFANVQRGLRGRDFEAAWRDYSRTWKRAWREAGARCRLDEADAATSPTVRALSRIHGQLEAAHHGYNALIGRIAHEQAPRLNRLAEELQTVERALGKPRPEAAPAVQP